MTCSYTDLVIWTIRQWFASDRSHRALAQLELAWTERDLACAWPRLALFLSVVDFERVRELEIAAPARSAEQHRRRRAHPAASVPLTGDEAAVLAALTCARWSTPDAALCLAGFLDPDSAAAAARAAARLREPRAERATTLGAVAAALSAPHVRGYAGARSRPVPAPHP